MLDSGATFFFAHIPFIATWFFFTYLTVVLDERVLSPRTIQEQFGGAEPLYWASLCLPILMIPLSASIGLFWLDPESLHWDQKWSVCYFLVAGCLSQLSWILLRQWAKKKGYRLSFPGMSHFPPPPSQDVDTHDL